MQSRAATRPNTERDIRELAQAVGTLEIIVTRLAIDGLAGRPRVAKAIAAELRSMADRAIYERDGACPVMLDRIADRISDDHAALA